MGASGGGGGPRSSQASQGVTVSQTPVLTEAEGGAELGQVSLPE